jgi:hypothetical protein
MSSPAGMRRAPMTPSCPILRVARAKKNKRQLFVWFAADNGSAMKLLEKVPDPLEI